MSYKARTTLIFAGREYQAGDALPEEDQRAYSKVFKADYGKLVEQGLVCPPDGCDNDCDCADEPVKKVTSKKVSEPKAPVSKKTRG